MEETNDCLFKEVLSASVCSSNKLYDENELSETRREKIKQCSKERKDNFGEQLIETKNKYHKQCYLYYTSKQKIKRHLDKTSQSSLLEPKVKRIRSSASTFDFKENCLFCGKKCSVEIDPKHPNRSKKTRGVLCRTADRGAGKKSFKEVISSICDTRNDSQGEDVRLRIAGAPSDLHAAEARYHKPCYDLFARPHHLPNTKEQCEPEAIDPLQLVIQTIRDNPDGTWNSSELYTLYTEHGGTETNMTRFIENITEEMQYEIYVFYSNGISSIIMHQNKASSMFNIAYAFGKEDINLHKTANQVKSEIKQATTLTDVYPPLSEDLCLESCSPTLMNLLSLISPKLHESLPALMIGSMVTSTVTTGISMLQVAIGVLLKEKKIINHLHEYRISATYDEIRRFKISAASTTGKAKTDSEKAGDTKKVQESVFDTNTNKGLIQGISDNFDASLSTQNGLKQTHSLATILTQHGTLDSNTTFQSIPRLKKEQLSTVKIEEVETKVYAGQKKPTMSDRFAHGCVLPLKVLCQKVLSVKKSEETDFEFIQLALTSDSIPDFNGYNTAKMRASEKEMKPKSDIRYRPLINKTPSDPSTMLTAMIDVESKTNEAGQQITVFTADQQLYRVALDILWSDPARWINFVPRLGGMHWLMSFVGCVGKLMAGSGLEEVMGAAFAGVTKMLVGKKFPMNVRALRLVLLEILRGHVNPSMSKSEFEFFIQDIAKKSITAEHWTKNFITPVLLMMMYCRAEREGDFALHLYVCEKMMVYFFCAGHWNYARDGISYLNSMYRLQKSTLDAFMRGEHVERHVNGLWNAIWSDMMIESSYMNKGKGPGGLIGITTSPRSAAIWANSHHICSELLCQLHGMRKSEVKREVTVHKEESTSRIKSDSSDRLKIRTFLQNCIHPLEHNEKTSTVLFNIYTGESVGGKSNVNKSVEIGAQQMSDFKRSLPFGFRNTLSSKVITMAQDKKSSTNQIVELYNTEMIFARVIYLLSLDKLDFSTLFNYELAPVVTSLVKDTGEPRYCNNKSVLQNKLKVDVSSRNTKPDAVIIDGGGMLHAKIHWPSEGIVNDLVEGIWNYIKKLTEKSTIYLIFDRYMDYSIKSDTRQERVGRMKRKYTFTLNGPLPPKDICLSSNDSKENLIEIIAKELLNLCSKFTNINVIITSKEATPIQSNGGIEILRHDMKTEFDEADYIIPQQVQTAIDEGATSITVISADTDVFVLLCHFYSEQNWKMNLYMQDFIDTTTCTCIKSTVTKHEAIIPSLLAGHALSGCDTVPSLFNVGKVKAIKVMKQFPLVHVGDHKSSEEEYLHEGAIFTGRCYGILSESNSSKNRLYLWKKKTDSAQVNSKPPELQRLPPTNEALALNIKKAHYQTVMWKTCLQRHPIDMDPCNYSWEKLPETKTLRPIMLPAGTKIAPDEVLKSSKCGCQASECKNRSCSCLKDNLPCTEFCGCAMLVCRNPYTIQEQHDEPEEDNATAADVVEGDI